MNQRGTSTNPQPDVDQVLDALVAVVRPYILSFSTRDSCIVTSAAVLDVLRAFGIEAQPLTVQVLVYNQAFLERWHHIGHPPRSLTETDQWWARYRAWHLGVGMGKAQPGKWSGHLVVTVPRSDQTSTMLDLSIDMASRPNRNMLVTPLKAEVPAAFVQGTELFVGFSGNTALRYTARPSDTSYEVSPGWQNAQMRLGLSAGVLRLVHGYLAGQRDTGQEP